MIIKLKKISLILFILIFFSDTLKSNQLFKDRKVLNKKQQTSTNIYLNTIDKKYETKTFISNYLLRSFLWITWQGKSRTKRGTTKTTGGNSKNKRDSTCFKNSMLLAFKILEKYLSTDHFISI